MKYPLTIHDEYSRMIKEIKRGLAGKLPEDINDVEYVETMLDADHCVRKGYDHGLRHIFGDYGKIDSTKKFLYESVKDYLLNGNEHDRTYRLHMLMRYDFKDFLMEHMEEDVAELREKKQFTEAREIENAFWEIMPGE